MPAHKEIEQVFTAEAYALKQQTQYLHNTDVVSVPDEIIRDATLNLSLNAARSLRVLYSLIRLDDPDNRIYRFPLDSYCEIFGLSSTNIYTNMKSACKELRESIEIPIKNGVRITGLINTAEVTDNEVRIQLDPNILKIFKKAKSLNSYTLECVSSFSYAVTFKFYEFCIMVLGDNNEIVYEIELDALKEYLQLSNKYNEYKDFKRRVLTVIINDINGGKFEFPDDNTCNIHVEFEEIKISRRVAKIVFKINRIRTIDVEADNEIQDYTATLSSEANFAYNWLRDTIKVHPSAIKHCINTYGEDVFLKVFAYIEDTMTSNPGKIKNKPGWAATNLRKGYYNEVSQQNIFAVISEEPIDEELVKLLESVGITKFDRQKELSSYSIEYIKANIEGIKKEYPNKSLEELAKLVYTAIKNDYADFNKKEAERLEKEKYAEIIKEYTEIASAMSINELKEQITELQNDDTVESADKVKIAQTELTRREKEKETSDQQLKNDAFDQFLATADDESKITILKEMLNDLTPFQVTALKNMSGVKDLNLLTVEQTLQIAMFRQKYQATFNKLMEL